MRPKETVRVCFTGRAKIRDPRTGETIDIDRNRLGEMARTCGLVVDKSVLVGTNYLVQDGGGYSVKSQRAGTFGIPTITTMEFFTLCLDEVGDEKKFWRAFNKACLSKVSKEI